MPENADCVVETQVFVDHTVMFHLGDAEQFVVPRRGIRGFVRVDWITVHFLARGRTQISAGGTVCKKDGTLSEHWGRTGVSVDLPDTASWTERAKLLIDGADNG